MAQIISVTLKIGDSNADLEGPQGGSDLGVFLFNGTTIGLKKKTAEIFWRGKYAFPPPPVLSEKFCRTLLPQSEEEGDQRGRAFTIHQRFSFDRPLAMVSRGQATGLRSCKLSATGCGFLRIRKM